MRLARLLVFILFAGLAGYAASASIADFGQAGIRAIAEGLELRRPLKAVDVHLAALSPEIDAALATCSSPLLRQAKTVILHDLNQVNQVADYDAWLKTHARGHSFIRAMIRCTPMDGDVWIRDAMVSRAIAEDADEIKIKLETSTQLSPFERQQLVARMAVWKRLSPHALSVNTEPVRSDLMTILRYGSDDSVKALAIDANTELLHMIAENIEELSSVRRRIIRPLLDLGRHAVKG